MLRMKLITWEGTIMNLNRKSNRGLVWSFSLLLLVFGFTMLGCRSAELSYMSASKSSRPANSRAAVESDVAILAQIQAADKGAPVPGAKAPQAKAPQADADANETKRIMIYSALIRMVVLNVRVAEESIQETAVKLGGYLQSLDGPTIVVKVPAAKFQTALDEFAKLGEVAHQQIKGLDVTEEFLDLRIRLDNAEKSRLRLLAILEKNQKLDETLKIERELQRITGTIEQIKGRLRFLSERAAYSTITVQLNSPVPQRQLIIHIPFEWVRDLGSELVAGTVPAYIDTGFFRPGLSCDLPDDYIKYYATPTETRGMSADGVLVKLKRYENYKGGNLTFWSKLVRRGLLESRAISLNEPRSIELAKGTKAVLLWGVKMLGKKKHGYMVAVVSTKHYVHCYEAWGPVEAQQADQAKLIESIKTLSAR